MNEKLKLFVVLLGGKPSDATIEQHNVFVGVAYKLEDLYGAIKRSWLAVRKVHIDAYMCVDSVEDYDVVICEKSEVANLTGIETEKNLFFVNVGFYKKNLMNEFHEIMLIVASNKDDAKTHVKNKFLTNCEDGIHSIHVDDCCLLSGDIDVEIPNDTGLDQKEFTVCLKKVRCNISLYPLIVVGYRPIP